jgi:hypothetical protein
MKTTYLTHDVAWATAKEIVEVFSGCLMDAEKHDAFVEIYTRVKAGLENFQILENRLHERMRPGAN